MIDILLFIIIGTIVLGTKIEQHQKAQYYRQKNAFDFDEINKIIEKNKRQ